METLVDRSKVLASLVGEIGWHLKARPNLECYANSSYDYNANYLACSSSELLFEESNNCVERKSCEHTANNNPISATIGRNGSIRIYLSKEAADTIRLLQHAISV